MDQYIVEELKYFSKLFFIAVGALLVFIILTGYIFYDFINQLLDTILYPLTAALVVLVGLVFLVYKTRDLNTWNIRYMFSAIFSLFMITFLQIFDWHTATSHTPFQRPIGHNILHLADFFIPIMILSVYLHFESISRATYNPTMMILLGLLIFPYLPLTILTIFFHNEQANVLLYDFLPFFSIATVIIVIFSIRVILRLYLSSVDRQIKRSSVLMIIGLFYLVFSFVTQIITPDTIDFGLFSANIFQLMILMLGAMLLTISYITHPIFLFASPYKIYSMIVYDAQGELIWSKNFEIESETDPSIIQLEVDVMSTIQLLLKQVSGFSGNIRQIEFSQQGRVVIEQIGSYTFLIITKGVSRQFYVALSQFVNFQTKRINHSIKLTDEALDIGLRLYFPYVYMYN